MTLNELKEEVLSLMFDTELDSHTAFVFAANRALMEIHSERDRTEKLKIYKKRLEAREHYKRLSYIPPSEIQLTLTGKAFSFTAVGKGNLLFTDGGLSETVNFSGNRSEIKRFINTGTAELKFFGDFSFEVYNLASFESITCDDAAKIPLFDEFLVFDVKEHDPLFLAFSSSVKSEYGVPIESIRAEGSLIYLPRDFDGELVISYKRMPKRVLDTEIDTKLDISDECRHLLALRCAAYLLLEENESLSEYYLSLYKNGMAAIKLYNRKEASKDYCDVLGWA